MNQPPLNPDALEVAADAVIDASFGQELPEAPIDLATAAVSAYLATAQTVVNSVEELDALPIGSVVIINGTMLQADDRDDYGTMWSRVRDIDAYPSEALALPARVLYRPEVKP